MENKRVLVASPTYKGMKYCHNEFFKAIKSLTYPLYDFLIIENSEDNEYFNKLKKEKGIILIKYNSSEKDKMLRLINSRNKIIDYALKNNYDFVLMMDCDVIPLQNIIEELIKCNKDIVSGLYFNYFVDSEGKSKFLPVAYMSITKKEFENFRKKVNLPPAVKSHLDLKGHLTKQEVESNKLLKVLIPSAGCMLISKKVIENKAIRYGLLDTQGFGDVHTTDDLYFMAKAREAGFDAYCYTKIKCRHLLKGKFRKDEKGYYYHPLCDDRNDSMSSNKDAAPNNNPSISISYKLKINCS